MADQDKQYQLLVSLSYLVCIAAMNINLTLEIAEHRIWQIDIAFDSIQGVLILSSKLTDAALSIFIEAFEYSRGIGMYRCFR